MAGALALTSAGVAEVIDAGTGADAATRANLILAQVLDGDDRDELPRGSLVSRDAWLLAVRCATFGDVLPARLRCPQCHTSLAVEIPRDSIPLPEPSWQDAAEVRVELGDLIVRARVPDGKALAAAAVRSSVDEARAVLIGECVTEAVRAGIPVDAAALAAAEVDAVGRALLDAEPGAEPTIEVTCASCAATWSPVFDIAQFLWSEVAAAGAQLLDEVHDLATAYGWSEDQILRLSSRRRREYVDRLHRQ